MYDVRIGDNGIGDTDVEKVGDSSAQNMLYLIREVLCSLHHPHWCFPVPAAILGTP